MSSEDIDTGYFFTGLIQILWISILALPAYVYRSNVAVFQVKKYGSTIRRLLFISGAIQALMGSIMIINSMHPQFSENFVFESLALSQQHAYHYTVLSIAGIYNEQKYGNDKAPRIVKMLTWLMIILCCISVFLSLPASERNLQRKIYGISYGIVLLTGIWSYSLTKRYSGTSITDQALVDLLRNYSFVIIPLWVVYAAVLVVFLVMSFEIDFGALEWFRIILSCITLLAFTSLIMITYCCHRIAAQSNLHGHNSGLSMVSTISNKSGVSDTNHSRTSTGAIKLHNNNDKDSLKNMKQKKMKLEMMPTNGNINRSKVLTPSSDKSETVSVKNEHQIPLGFVDENEPHKNTLPKTSVVNTNTNSLKLKTNQSVESQEDSVQDDDEKYGKNEQKNYIPSTQPLKRNISIPWHDNMVPRTYSQSISRKLSDKRSNIRSIHLQPTQNQSKSMSSNISSTRQPLDFSSKEIVDPMPQFDNDNSQMHLRGRQESGSRAVQSNSQTDYNLYNQDDQVELSAMTTIIHQSSIVESINASNDLSSNESEQVRNNSQDITQVERTSNVQNETKEDDTAHFKSDDGQIH